MGTYRRLLLGLLAVVAMVTVACAWGTPSGVPIIALPTQVSSPDTTPDAPMVATPTPAEVPVASTIAEVYRRAAQALDQPGLLYHATVQRTSNTVGTLDPEGLGSSTTELWVDGSRDAARLESRYMRGSSLTIVTPQGRYILGRPDNEINLGDAPRCPGTSLAVAVILGCPDAPFETYTFETSGGSPQKNTATPTITIATDGFAGRPAILVVAVKRQQPWRSGPVTETQRLYLDPDTFLPFVEETERVSGDYTTLGRAEYAHEFIPADTVPADFFEPLALRRIRPDPQGALDQPPPGLVLYWPGARFAAAGVPPLELWRVRRFNPADRPWVADQFTLEYTSEDNPFGGEPLLRIWEYAHAVWESTPTARIDPDGPCWTQEDIDLPGGRATIFRGFTWPGNVPPPPGECPSDRPHDRFLAHAFLGETVVVIEPWSWPDQTREGIETVVRALQPRWP